MTAFEEDTRPPRPGRRMLKRFALGALLIAVLSAATVASAVLLEVKTLTTIVKTESHPIVGIKGALDDVQAGKPETILILGSDRRFVDIKQKNPARSDTLMLVRLDPSAGSTAVMNIPRDLKVDIKTPHGYVTDKINSAYAIGGPKLAVETVRLLLGIPIHHVVNVNFGGFQRAVNRLGCVYVDVDHRYYHSNIGLPPSQQYAEINIQPGYQMLCGSKSLDYVRYRHTDSDLVRADRQQDFLRQAKEQIGLGQLFSDRKELLRIFGRYTQTDIAGDNQTAILRFLKLVFESSRNPIRQVAFPGRPGPTYVTVSPRNLQAAVDDFLHGSQSTGPRQHRSTGSSTKHRKSSSASATVLAPGLVDDRTQAEDMVAQASTRLNFPVYFARARLARGSYPVNTQIAPNPRVYRISDRHHHRYGAYRVVVFAGLDGEYYGIQGTSWRNAPILTGGDTVRMRGRNYEIYYDGHRIRMISWVTPRGAYWISNTLSLTLTNRQMTGIARSLTRVGAK